MFTYVCISESPAGVCLDLGTCVYNWVFAYTCFCVRPHVYEGVCVFTRTCACQGVWLCMCVSLGMHVRVYMSVHELSVEEEDEEEEEEEEEERGAVGGGGGVLLTCPHAAPYHPLQ